MNYFIKRIKDKLWWDGEGWSPTTAKKLSAAKAGEKLAELPGGMEDGVYKLVKEKVEIQQVIKEPSGSSLTVQYEHLGGNYCRISDVFITPKDKESDSSGS